MLTGHRTLNKDKGKSCEGILSKHEWKILYQRFNKGQEATKPPNIGEACKWIARLGGSSTENQMVLLVSLPYGKVGRASMIWFQMSWLFVGNAKGSLDAYFPIIILSFF